MMIALAAKPAPLSLGPQAMSKAALLALADRVEALTGPCRETDELITAALVGAVRQVQPFHNSVAHHNAEGTMWVSVNVPSPGVTASLDAAMTLVPEGWSPSVGQNVHHLNWHAFVQTLCTEGEPITMGEAHAATPALALTAAALRAYLESL
jgi:hypothetical protein